MNSLKYLLMDLKTSKKILNENALLPSPVKSSICISEMHERFCNSSSNFKFFKGLSSNIVGVSSGVLTFVTMHPFSVSSPMLKKLKNL